MTNEESRKLKNYLKNKPPCKDCISYAVCQNEDVVTAVWKCIILSVSISGFRKEGLSMVISKGKHKTTLRKGFDYRYYVYYDTAYLGNLQGTREIYYGKDTL